MTQKLIVIGAGMATGADLVGHMANVGLADEMHLQGFACFSRPRHKAVCN